MFGQQRAGGNCSAGRWMGGAGMLIEAALGADWNAAGNLHAITEAQACCCCSAKGCRTAQRAHGHTACRTYYQLVCAQICTHFICIHSIHLHAFLKGPFKQGEKETHQWCTACLAGHSGSQHSMAQVRTSQHTLTCYVFPMLTKICCKMYLVSLQQGQLEISTSCSRVRSFHRRYMRAEAPPARAGVELLAAIGCIDTIVHVQRGV